MEEGPRVGPGAPKVKPPDTGETQGATRLQTLRLRQAKALREDDERTTIAIQREIVAIYRNRVQNTKLTGQALVRFQEELSAEEDKLDGYLDAQTAANAAARQSRLDARVEARNKADQKFLTKLSRGRRQYARAVEIAAGTETAKDDVAPLVALKNRIIEEIRLAKQNIKDLDVLAATLEQLNIDLDGVVDAINQARKGRNAALATERTSAADARTAFLAKQVTLAGLRENDAAELKALNKAIADARYRVNNWKKLGLVQIDEKIALETLINNRDELLDTAKKAQKGTSAYDLLVQSAQTFGQTAGNLITPDQPFTGRQGYTADISRFLSRQAGKAAVPKAPGTPPTATTGGAGERASLPLAGP